MSDNTQPTRQGLPSLPKSTNWMLSFGFLGVQTAFTLQSSQMSRIFQTLGADVAVVAAVVCAVTG